MVVSRDVTLSSDCNREASFPPLGATSTVGLRAWTGWSLGVILRPAVPVGGKFGRAGRFRGWMCGTFLSSRPLKLPVQYCQLFSCLQLESYKSKFSSSCP